MKKPLSLLILFSVAFTALEGFAEEKKKIVILEGKPNPGAIASGVPFPAMENRPEALKPEPLPPRVRYKFAPDAAVVAAANLLNTHLQAEPADGEALFGDSVIVQPGAWRWLKPFGGMGKKSATPLNGLVAIGGKKLNLEGIFLKDQKEIAALEKALRELIKRDGGGVVRALKSDEMNKWWTFIGFDIEEPVFVLETKEQKHLFILGFSRQKLLLVDELNGLPN